MAKFINRLFFLAFFTTPLWSNAQLQSPGDSEVGDSSIHIPKQIDADTIYVGNITITGNRKTRPEIVLREVALEPNTNYKGDEFNRKVRLTREQLMNTRLFIDVIINWQVDPVTKWNEVMIEVKERWYFFPLPYFKVIDRNWNVWINEYGASLSRTNYGVKLFHTNFSGRNDKLDIWIINGYTQQLQFKYQLPFADKKLQKGYNVGVAYGRNREINYASDSNKQQFAKFENFGRQWLKAEIDFSYRRDSKERVYVKSIYGFEKIDSTFFKLNPNYLGGTTKANYFDLVLNYQYYNVDYIPFPLRGWYVDFAATKRFSRHLSLSQISGAMLTSWKFMPKTYVNFQSSFAWTLPKTQPYYNQRLMGYSTLYMQGYEYYVMDGTFGIMGRATLRRELFALTFKGPSSWKAYSRIPFKFYGKTYGNLGYAYNQNPGSNYLNNRLLSTGGFGLEVATIYDFVFKFEYSFNQLGERGFFFHTSADF